MNWGEKGCLYTQLINIAVANVWLKTCAHFYGFGMGCFLHPLQLWSTCTRLSQRRVQLIFGNFVPKRYCFSPGKVQSTKTAKVQQSTASVQRPQYRVMTVSEINLQSIWDIRQKHQHPPERKWKVCRCRHNPGTQCSPENVKNPFSVHNALRLHCNIYVTSSSVFYNEETVSIGLKKVIRLVTSILQN